MVDDMMIDENNSNDMDDMEMDSEAQPDNMAQEIMANEQYEEEGELEMSEVLQQNANNFDNF